MNYVNESIEDSIEINKSIENFIDINKFIKKTL